MRSRSRASYKCSIRPVYDVAAPAPWRSGYAAACKAVYTGSIPVGASRKIPAFRSFAAADGPSTASLREEVREVRGPESAGIFVHGLQGRVQGIRGSRAARCHASLYAAV